MAYKQYDEDQSIHSMTTRQLRLYIKDKATSAQARVDSLNMNDADRALKDAVDAITSKSGRVNRSTSNMDKAQMREYAYALRTFEKLDTDSGVARKTAWEKDKARYQKFVKNRIAEGDKYWEQYKTEKGNISKKGYEDYKQYIAFIKEIESVKYQYTYKTIKQYGVNQLYAGNESEKRLKEMSKILNKVYKDNKGLGLTTSQLIDKFNLEWDDYVEKHDFKPDQQPKVKLKAPKYKSKKSKQKSSSNVKTKTVGKMKTHGTVHK